MCLGIFNAFHTNQSWSLMINCFKTETSNTQHREKQSSGARNAKFYWHRNTPRMKNSSET